MELKSPDGKSLYKDVKKQYDSFTWTAASKGTYEFCFSNEFSTFTHKVIYFDILVGEEKPLQPGMANVAAMTMVRGCCNDKVPYCSIAASFSSTNAQTMTRFVLQAN